MTHHHVSAPNPWQDKIGFGAAYYHEYHMSNRLEEDLDMMVDGGFNVIRVGESVWSTWEPQDGVFNLEWLNPILDAAHERGIDVIIGTPTYAAPPWMRKKYPETTLHVATGVEKPYGGRQNVNYHNATFRRLAERIIRKIVEKYRNHPAVVGWQVDNEPGLSLIYNPDVFEDFKKWLAQRYGNVDVLNRAWGLTYWSHRISTWDELWTPEGNTVPSYDLAWRTFQAEVTHDMIRWQANLVRAMVPDSHVVTTCIATNQPGQIITKIASPLDVAGSNIYFNAQAGLEKPGANHLDPKGGPAWVTWSGPAYVQMLLDLSRGMKDAPFIVTETEATSVGYSHNLIVPWPGQRRQIVWQMIARGARMIEYWHWHTNRFGFETWWEGILGHSLQPARTYRELSAVAHELEQYRYQITNLTPCSDIGVIVTAKSRWGVEFQPPFGEGLRGDEQAYDKGLAMLMRGIQDAGLTTDIIDIEQLGDSPEAMVRRWPVLVCAYLYIISDADLHTLRQYMAAGGHLIIMPRTGMADEEAIVRDQVMPGVFRADTGAFYEESTTLVTPVAVTGQLHGHAQWYADCVQIDSKDAHVLGSYKDPFLKDYAAIVTHKSGKGRATLVGCYPDCELAQSLFKWITQISLTDDPWRNAMNEQLTHTKAQKSHNKTLHFVHNWSWNKSKFILPEETKGLDGTSYSCGEEIELSSWDVQIFCTDTE